MKLEDHDGTLTFRGTIKDRDLERLRDELAARIDAGTLQALDLSAVRAFDVYLLQLLAVALSEAATRGRGVQLKLPLAGVDLAARVGLEPHLAPFLPSRVPA